MPYLKQSMGTSEASSGCERSELRGYPKGDMSDSEYLLLENRMSQTAEAACWGRLWGRGACPGDVLATAGRAGGGGAGRVDGVDAKAATAAQLRVWRGNRLPSKLVPRLARPARPMATASATHTTAMQTASRMFSDWPPLSPLSLRLSSSASRPPAPWPARPARPSAPLRYS